MISQYSGYLKIIIQCQKFFRLEFFQFSSIFFLKSLGYTNTKGSGSKRSRSPSKNGIYDPISIPINFRDLKWSKSIENDLNWSRSWKDRRSAMHCLESTERPVELLYWSRRFGGLWFPIGSLEDLFKDPIQTRFILSPSFYQSTSSCFLKIMILW